MPLHTSHRSFVLLSGCSKLKYQSRPRPQRQRMITSSRVRSQRPAATGDTSHFSPHFGVQSTVSSPCLLSHSFFINPVVPGSSLAVQAPAHEPSPSYLLGSFLIRYVPPNSDATGPHYCSKAPASHHSLLRQRLLINLHSQYIHPRIHDNCCSSLLVAVWSGFGLFSPTALLLAISSFLSTIPIASVDCLQLSTRLITLRL